MKTCTKCKIEKPKADFSKCSSKKDGSYSWCKECRRKYNKENADKIAEYQRAYRDEYPEKLARLQRELRKANPVKFAEYRRKYVKANPEKISAHCRNRRARSCQSDGTHNAEDVSVIFENQRSLCANCKSKLIKSGKKKYHVDHIMPLALGGSNWPWNLQCLCPSCNLSKSAKHPVVWANENGRLI